MPDNRLQAMHKWLASLAPSLGLQLDTLQPISGDASFRHYYRLEAGIKSLLVMDAPPPHEDCRPFVHVAGLLAQGGLVVPEIHAQNHEQGFLLISDLGRDNFLDAIRAGWPDDQLQQHYRGALRALVRLQQCRSDGLPLYTADRLEQELQLFTQWYLQVHHGHVPDAGVQDMLDQVFSTLAHHIAALPRVPVHRDYHSPNLIIGARAPDYIPGIIDFQDALLGPLTYDIASLAMDARTSWDESQQLDWAIRYWEYAREAQLPVPGDFASFHLDYEWTSLQRNLRILGVFARLSHRDGKHHYMEHIPRVLSYIRQVAGRYVQFHPLLRLLDQVENTPLATGYSF